MITDKHLLIFTGFVLLLLFASALFVEVHSCAL